MTLPARTQLANEDLLPVSPDRRTWNWWHIASLWIGMAICIPTYTLASGLVDQGWTWQAAVGAGVLGDERVDRAPRHGLDQVPGNLGFTIPARSRCCALHLGLGPRG